MKKFTIRRLGVAFGMGVLLAGSSAQAGTSPLGLALVPPAQLPPQDFVVAGARVDLLLGKHRSVYGFDLGGIGNMTENSFGGVQVAGGFNYNQGTATVLGLQAAGAGNFNVNKLSLVGLQVAVGVNSNQAESSVVGLQVAGANLSEHTRVIGAQVGLYNKAGDVYGFQVGLVNSAQQLHGIQLGLLNYNVRGLFSVAPFLNIGF